MRFSVSAPPRRRPLAMTLGLALSTVVGVASVSADDTEVFFGQVDRGTNIYPNVLFVLDTSGSMNWGDAGQSGSRLSRLKTAMKEILANTANVNVGLMRFNGSGGGGSVIYPMTPIDKELCEDGDCGTVSLSKRIASDWDDVEEYLDSNDLLGTGNILSMGETGNGRSQAVGLRFTDLAIPRGANIVDARLEFVAERNGNQASELSIRAEKVGDSPIFDDDDGDVSDRDTTLASLPWYPAAWQAGKVYQTQNLNNVVQEVVNQDDWCGGQALSFVITGEGERAAKTFENSSEESALLKVTYDASQIAPGGGCMEKSTVAIVSHYADDAEQNLSNHTMNLQSSDLEIPRNSSRQQMVGVRFDMVDVPKDATITEASIEFEVDKHQTGNARARIWAEAAGDAARFNGSRYELTSRNKTSESVLWKNIPAAGVNAKVRTTDLSSVVQQVVGRLDWQAGNAMAFYFRRDGGAGNRFREFESFDGERAAAPKLRLTYRQDSVLGEGNTIVARDRMTEVIDSLTATGGTPIVDAYYEAARYYLGGTVDYGTSRGKTYYGNNQRSRYHRISHPDSYTGGAVQTPYGCSVNDADNPNCINEKIVGNASYISPLENSCQTNHIVFLSDGEATSITSQGKVQSLIGKSCDSSGPWNERCGAELAEWLDQTDHNPNFANKQNISTYTIGFNLDNPTFLQSLASDGGGDFYEAQSAAELTARFQDILTDVLSVDTSFTAPGATVNQFNRLTHREDIYFALFRPDQKPTWDGNLKRYRVGQDSDGDGEIEIRGRDGEIAVDPSTGFFRNSAKSYWPERDDSGQEISAPDGDEVARGGAANQLSLQGPNGSGSRRLFTYVSDKKVPKKGVVLDAVENALHEDNDDITDAILGIENVMPTAGEQAEYRESLLQWSRGVDVKDVDEDDDVTEVRPQMGDPMHSRPAILNYKVGTESESVVYMATNQGYLHAIDADDGSELWAFVPDDLLPNLNDFYEDSASTRHPYGLDGPLSTWRIDDDQDFIIERDEGEEAFIYIGMRRGGSNYYAFDVSDRNNPKLAWEIKGGNGDFKELGQSWSRMTPAKIQYKGKARDVLIFGAGYSENQDPTYDPITGGLLMSQTADPIGRGVFIVDARTGKKIWSALGSSDGDQNYADMDYSIPGDIRVADTDLDGYADQLYASDTGGQLWRFDIAKYHESGDLLTGGVMARISGPAAKDQRRFYSEPDVALVESRGSRFLAISIGSGWRAHPLNERVEDRFYVFKSSAVRGAPEGYGKKVGASSLAVWTPITESDLVNVTGELDPESNAYGWYIDLPEPGEKILGKSVTFDNSVLFSSFYPDTNVELCGTALGSGRVYALDVATGRPKKDLDGDGDIDLSDVSKDLNHGGIPPEPAILITESGKPKAMVGPETFDADLDNTTKRTFWSDQGPQRTTKSVTVENDNE